MQGIVSVLDPHHSEKVSELWRTLKQLFDVGNPAATSVPHISYHIAEAYDLARVTTILADTAASTRPFTVRTSGMALFTGPEPTVYIPVVRTSRLSALHSPLWSSLSAAAEGASPYYHPASWLPHITLEHGDITSHNLGQVLQWLNEQDLAWEIQIDNFAILLDTVPYHTSHSRFPFEKSNDS